MRVHRSAAQLQGAGDARGGVEQLASENAAALEEAQVVRDQAEDRAAKLEAEKVLLRMQLDETERLAKVRVTPCRVAENVTEGRGVVFVVLGPREHAE